MRRTRESRILVVDDHAAERRQIVSFLRANGLVVADAGNAYQAAALLRRQPRDIGLVILDIVGTSCLDLAAEIERDGNATPVLYISGHVDSLVVQAIGWHSPELLLVKPFSGKLLLERVHRLVQRRAPGAHSAVAEISLSNFGKRASSREFPHANIGNCQPARIPPPEVSPYPE
jgi:DNA-binding response OmpR family regulator